MNADGFVLIRLCQFKEIIFDLRKFFEQQLVGILEEK
jgi:hypothetical protein